MPARPMRVVVRPREEDDAEPLVEALARVQAEDAYPLMGEHVTRAWLYDGDFEAAWVAEVDGRAAAQVALSPGFDDPAALAALGRPAAEVLALSRFFVGPSARGGGAGHALLAAAEAYAGERGRGLALEVLDHNVGAIGLYEARGWRRVGERDVDWFGPDGPHPLACVYVWPADQAPVAGSEG